MNDLHAAIMNLPCKPYDGTDAYTHYCRGHRDARHAAAELVAAAGAKESRQTTTYWMVERGPNQGEQQIWWWESRESYCGRWTQSLRLASRWATKEEAECVARTLSYCEVTEHMDVPPLGTQSTT